MRTGTTKLALGCVLGLWGCELMPLPATQVTVALHSDMDLGTELSRVHFEMWNAKGTEGPFATLDFALDEEGGSGKHELPLTFSLVPAAEQPEDRFQLIAYGYREHGDDEPFVEQKVIASFLEGRSLLLDVFLPRVCADQVCDTESTCHVEVDERAAAGECGRIPERELEEVDPGDALDEVVWPEVPEGSLGADARDAGPRERDGAHEDPEKGDGKESDAEDDEEEGESGEVLACDVDVELPGDLCEGADGYEDNDSPDDAAELVVEGDCEVFVAALEGSERDYYTYQATMREAVQLTLSYTAVGDADLGIDGVSLSDAKTARLESSETEVFTWWPGEPGERLTWSVEGENESCQPYALRVDSAFCTDVYEDNDTKEEAADFEPDEEGRITWEANAYRNDSDWYQFAVERRDPFLLTGSYTVDGNSSADLNLRFTPVVGSLRSDTARRVSTSEQWSLWGYPDGPGAIFRVQVDGFDAGWSECVPYVLNLDTRACTDEFEDNDFDSQPYTVSSGTTYEATVIDLDDDYYDVSGLSGGTCTVEYTPMTPGTNPVRVEGFVPGNSSYSATVTEGADGARVLTVPLTDRISQIHVESIEDDVCHPYTLRCE